MIERHVDYSFGDVWYMPDDESFLGRVFGWALLGGISLCIGVAGLLVTVLFPLLILIELADTLL